MTWPIPLDRQPTIAQMGIGIHGERQLTDIYRLPTLWCIHFYRYHAEVLVNGQPLTIRPGSVSVFPPDATLEYRYRGRSVHAYAHFRLPDGPATAQIPVLQEAPTLRPSFEEAIGWMPAQRLRAEVRLWDILWQLAAAAAAPPVHPAVAEALRLIELRLGDTLYVPDLARAVGLSPNHLTRLFVAATGKGVATYIRDRRIERATHLLRHTTRPIKSIAVEVGIPDLHLFNKYVRRALGASPRQARQPRPASPSHA